MGKETVIDLFTFIETVEFGNGMAIWYDGFRLV